MKQNLKWIFKYGACLLALVLLVGLFSIPLRDLAYEGLGKVQQAYRGVYGEPENSLDVIFAGDSECYCSISPMELWEQYGMASHCVSDSGKSLQTVYEYLYFTLQKQQPRVLVLETNCLYEPADFEQMLRSELRIHVPLFANHEGWRRIPLSNPGKTEEDLDIDDVKGYNYSIHVDPWQGEPFMIPTEDREPLSPWAKLPLQKLTKLCRDRDIQLVLLTVPNPLFSSWEKHNTIEDFAKENGLTYVDLNLQAEELGIDWNLHTRDRGDHMNHQGAAIVTDWLGSWLHGNYDLPDHRGDPAYAQWEVSLQNYHAMLESADPDWQRVLRDPEKP